MRWFVGVIIAVVIAGAVAAASYFIFHEEVDFIVDKTLKTAGLIPFGDWARGQEKEAEILNAKEALESRISLLAVGDIMLSRVVGQKMVAYKDYHFPFLKVQDLIGQADISFGNLESPIIKGAPVKTGSFNFRADPEAAESLSFAGFDVLSLANNHILNQGQDGLQKTFYYLKEQKIDYCGAVNNSGKLQFDTLLPTIREVKGAKIGFLCYGYGPENYAAKQKSAGIILMDEEQLARDIQNAKEQNLVDFLVVSMHDGVEYQKEPSARQKSFAHRAIDLGADLVVGHHAHVVQEIEQYKGKYIFYGLGNFVFDQMWSEETRKGLAVKFIIKKESAGVFKVETVEQYPVIIEDYGQPSLVRK
ncbi:CapA family protein [Candidatus Falkowbacteria bacterium]|nr:CapA family protein [Candidatus Falkowbacteria bacterium]